MCLAWPPSSGSSEVAPGCFLSCKGVRFRVPPLGLGHSVYGYGFRVQFLWMNPSQVDHLVRSNHKPAESSARLVSFLKLMLNAARKHITQLRCLLSYTDRVEELISLVGCDSGFRKLRYIGSASSCPSPAALTSS